MYNDAFNLLTNDASFRGRVGMCVAEQAKIFVNDARPEFYQPAQIAIADYRVLTDQLLPLVVTQPAMSETASDGDILAAVQALWPVVGARFKEPEPPPEP